MKSYLLALILFLSIPAAAFSQGNYKPGYIITSNGDSLKGAVLYKNWGKNPSKFSFMNAGGSKMTCNFENTAAVVVSGHVSYKRFVVWVSRDRYVDLTFRSGTDNVIGADSTKQLDTVFLKLITAGKNVSLYSYADFVKKRFFISEHGETPVELILHKYVEQDPKLIAVDDRKYKVQLQALRSVYAEGNIALIDAIQLAEYDDSDLCKIVDKLNGN